MRAPPALLASLFLAALGTVAALGALASELVAPSPSPLRPSASSERVEALLASMSLEEKVGQVLLSYPPLDRQGPVWVGGVVLTGNLLKDAESVRARVADLQARARVPLLVAVDEEGGDFNRLSFLPGLEEVPSARELGRLGPEQARSWGERVGRGMRSLGIDLSLAPVLDLASRGMMYESGRSMGSDPEQVGATAAAYAEGLAAVGVAAVGKHFPGYGELEANTDYHLLVRGASRAELEREIRAFERAGPALSGVMLSNVAYQAYGGVPAILSPELVQRAHENGWFTVTDDLAIGALAEATGGDPAELVRRAFRAGNDLLLTTAPPDWDKGLDYRAVLLDLLRSEPALQASLDERLRRVLALKDRLGLLPAD